MRYEYVYSSNQYVPKRKHNVLKALRLIIFSIVIFLIGFYTTSFIHRTFFARKVASGIISPITDPISESFGAIQGIMTASQLSEVVEKELRGTQGTYSVAIKNLKTGESYFLNADKKYDSASLYKLWTMATVFQEIERGNINPEKRIFYDITEINNRFDIATESAELTEGTFSMSVKDALTQMITISHNYAALSLTLEVGLTDVSKFLKDNGFSQSSTKSPPQTTATDILRFYEKLYAGELGSSESSMQMVTLLKRQQLNDRIPKYLPEGVEVAHKTGELGFVKHDAGIVYSDAGDYIIVLMSETASPLGAAEREALLSKDVYEYFQRR